MTWFDDDDVARTLRESMDGVKKGSHRELGLNNPWIRWNGKYKGIRFELAMQGGHGTTQFENDQPIWWGATIQINEDQLPPGLELSDLSTSVVHHVWIDTVHDGKRIANLAWDWQHSGWHCPWKVKQALVMVHEQIDELLEIQPNILRVSHWDGKFYPADGMRSTNNQFPHEWMTEDQIEERMKYINGLKETS